MSRDPGSDLSLFDGDAYRETSRILRERFVVPPMSVLDAFQPYWRDRKRNWLSLGIESEVGRDGSGRGAAFKLDSETTTEVAEQIRSIGEVSVFDPVLCEVAYRWWSPSDGVVLDAFAGGSVRGVVAAMLGRTYHGVELRPEQVVANREQDDRLHDLYPATGPTWYEGDSRVDLPDVRADFLWTCPPYGSLEVYSDDPRDISGMDPSSFDSAYREILAESAARLRPDRFAAIVVGNYRDGRGVLQDLVGLTVDAYRSAGLVYYSELVLLTPIGTAAVLASRLFAPGRKPRPRHQHVLVFVKGDWRRAAAAAEALPERDG